MRTKGSKTKLVGLGHNFAAPRERENFPSACPGARRVRGARWRCPCSLLFPSLVLALCRPRVRTSCGFSSCDGLLRNQKLDNAKELRGIFFIEPDDEEFKLIAKAARRKLEVPMPAAMPRKTPIKSFGETHRNIGKRETKCACIFVADVSTRPRREGAGNKPHRDHITAEGMNSMTHYSLVHKFIPMYQAVKMPNAKAAVVK